VSTIYAPELLDALETVAKPWRGSVWRQVIGDLDPTRPNVRGARWNPAQVEALYLMSVVPTRTSGSSSPRALPPRAGAQTLLAPSPAASSPETDEARPLPPPLHVDARGFPSGLWFS
jgi:hypothetical protein